MNTFTPQELVCWLSPEMEKGRCPLVSIPPFGRGFSGIWGRIAGNGHSVVDAGNALSLWPGQNLVVGYGDV
jgi:hypothetical protein